MTGAWANEDHLLNQTNMVLESCMLRATRLAHLLQVGHQVGILPLRWFTHDSHAREPDRDDFATLDSSSCPTFARTMFGIVWTAENSDVSRPGYSSLCLEIVAASAST